MVATETQSNAHPDAPEGFRYSFTLHWEINRPHLIPYENLNRVVLSSSGIVLGSGLGRLQVWADELPSAVHIYVPLATPRA
jgi:hypothetical protein